MRNRTSHIAARPLTPEEDAIDDLDGDDEIDDTLPADLWFHHPGQAIDLWT